MRLQIVLIVLCGVAITTSAFAEDPVEFADPGLKAAIENELWLSDPTPTDLLGLTQLNAAGWGIRDLGGLEYAVNLQKLLLRWNYVSDISALSALTNLHYLDAHDNDITDLTPLAELRDLRTLVIRLNPVSDLTPLAGLTTLENLDARFIEVSDLSPLSGLVNLEYLGAAFNFISDLPDMSALTALRYLDLGNNTISDVAPLAALSNLQDLLLSANPIHDIAPLAEMTWLQSLDLGGNEELGQDAYCHHLHTLAANGTGVQYDLNFAAPTGVKAVEHRPQGVEVSWNAVCNGPLYSVYYQVYRSLPPSETRIAVSDWQSSRHFKDTTAEPGVQYAYWVRTAVSDRGANPGNLSSPAYVSPAPAGLLLSSTAGGSVTAPGEGWFPAQEKVMTVIAAPLDPNLYFFIRWTGSAVDAGKVSDPCLPSTDVVVDANDTLQAHFATWMDVLYVDSNTPNDLGSSSGDLYEDGTASHPFDRVQEAIEVALDGAVIVVRAGTYRENIDLLGKGVLLTGLDPHPGAPEWPVLEGSGAGPVVSFTHGEDPNCTLAGFVISGGRDARAAAIACLGSSPTVVNCLIVGNRATDTQGGAIYCRNSQALFEHCTIADNAGGKQGAGIVVADSNIVITNSIVWGNAPAPLALDGDASFSVTYTDVTGGWPGEGNLDAAPHFIRAGYWADPNDPATEVGPGEPDAVWAAGDYHLQSQAGRWSPHTQTWETDEVTSPCIDAGDPAASVGNELPPHGNITNMGAYGGTVQASLGQ